MPKVYYIAGCPDAAQYLTETDGIEIDMTYVAQILHNESTGIECAQFDSHDEVEAFTRGLDVLDYSGFDHIVVSENLALPIIEQLEQLK